MVKLENYLTDGMNWQAQMVLAYIRGHHDYAIDESYIGYQQGYDAQLFVSTYDYGREKGYVVSLRYKNKKQRNYAFYEHCISDSICLVISDAYTDHSDGWDGKEWSKYDHDAEFECGGAAKCGMFIINDIRNTIREWKNEDEQNEYDDEKRKMVDGLRDAIKEHGTLSFASEDKVFYPIFCGETQRESILEVYLDDDDVPTILTDWDDNGEKRLEYTRFADFSNKEMKTILNLCGLAR